MDKNSKNNKEIASGYLPTSNKNNDFNNNAQQELNLKNKLTNAFSDLEYLKRSLKDIRGTKDDLKSKPLHNQTYDFFSDDRYRSVLDQIKQSNPDRNKIYQQKIASSKDKYMVSSMLGLIKPTKDSNSKESNGERSNYFILFYFLFIYQN